MRIVDIHYPVGRRTLISSSVKIAHSADVSIYDTVNEMKNIIHETPLRLEDVQQQIPLAKIINLHNGDGIRDIKQIEDFIDGIESGIYYPDDFPNIKLVQINDDEYVIFDGHHSMIAFMFVGRKFLHEIPHLVVRNESGFISSKELCVFFGHNSAKIKPENWRDYTINWQNPEEKQLSNRVQNNMQELFEAVKPLINQKL
jgi:hypothetical protein